MSVAMPVAVSAPLEKFRCVPATVLPLPIWRGLIPPLRPFGPAPSDWVRLNMDSNSIRVDLKAVVLTLAMLLPMTFSRLWLLSRPERPV